MQQSVTKLLKGGSVNARDGGIGSVKDVYFDDREWKVRFVIVDTGNWLAGRQVAIPSTSVHPAEGGNVTVDLTREQVEHARPAADTPTASNLEEQAREKRRGDTVLYSFPMGWGGSIVTPAIPGSPELRHTTEQTDREARALEARAGETHLRSANEVVGYAIHATDGRVGHVDDLLIDDGNWSVNGLVVDTREWWPGGQVAIPATEVNSIDWEKREIRLRMSQAEVKAGSDAP
mgnify:CR=1 FL=1